MPAYPGDIFPKEPSVRFDEDDSKAEIEDCIEGFNQPRWRGMQVNGERVSVWSSQHGWSGL